MAADFLSEIMEARKKQNFFQVLKEKNCHPVKIPLTSECEIKALSDEEKLRENLFARFPLRKKKMLKTVLQTEKWYQKETSGIKKSNRNGKYLGKEGVLFFS